jgi:hypothetical protein
VVTGVRLLDVHEYDQIPTTMVTVDQLTYLEWRKPGSPPPLPLICAAVAPGGILDLRPGRIPLPCDVYASTDGRDWRHVYEVREDGVRPVAS